MKIIFVYGPHGGCLKKTEREVVPEIAQVHGQAIPNEARPFRGVRTLQKCTPVFQYLHEQNLTSTAEEGSYEQVKGQINGCH